MLCCCCGWCLQHALRRAPTERLDLVVADLGDLTRMVEADLPGLDQVLSWEWPTGHDPVCEIRPGFCCPAGEPTTIQLFDVARPLLTCSLTLPDCHDATFHWAIWSADDGFDFFAGPDLRHDELRGWFGGGCLHIDICLVVCQHKHYILLWMPRTSTTPRLSQTKQ